MNFETIETAETRLELARWIASDMAGKRSSDGLTVTEVGDFVVIDDGQDTWIATEDDYSEAANELLSLVLDGSRFDGQTVADERAGEVPWYDDFCMSCEHVYSRIGTPNDIADLCERVWGESDLGEFEQIAAALHIDDEDFVRLVLTLNSRGDVYSGGDPVDAAKQWTASFDDFDEAIEWLDAGFWDAETAGKIAKLGIEPSEIDELCTRLIKRDGESAFTDGSPVYSVCNGDTPAAAFESIKAK